jgi:hypothetical protein
MEPKRLNFAQLVKPIIPVGLLNLRQKGQQIRQQKRENERRAKFEQLRCEVLSTIAAIKSLTSQQCHDVKFLENEFIPLLGLNNELLHEQPPELARYFGSGLHIWQYPAQLARYLAWLSGNAKNVNCYMEIGCRWGGTLILVAEWLRKNGANLHTVIAIDPIKPTPFVDEYSRFLQEEKKLGRRKTEMIYVRNYSTSAEVGRLVEQVKPDFVFIDGNHDLRVALEDHMLVRDSARLIVHHDIASQACPDTTFLWKTLKELERFGFDFFEFVDQYESVSGNFLGIGVMQRRNAAKREASQK